MNAKLQRSAGLVVAMAVCVSRVALAEQATGILTFRGMVNAPPTEVCVLTDGAGAGSVSIKSSEGQQHCKFMGPSTTTSPCNGHQAKYIFCEELPHPRTRTRKLFLSLTFDGASFNASITGHHYTTGVLELQYAVSKLTKPMYVEVNGGDFLPSPKVPAFNGSAEIEIEPRCVDALLRLPKSAGPAFGSKAKITFSSSTATCESLSSEHDLERTIAPEIPLLLQFVASDAEKSLKIEQNGAPNLRLQASWTTQRAPSSLSAVVTGADVHWGPSCLFTPTEGCPTLTWNSASDACHRLGAANARPCRYRCEAEGTLDLPAELTLTSTVRKPERWSDQIESFSEVLRGDPPADRRMFRVQTNYWKARGARKAGTRVRAVTIRGNGREVRREVLEKGPEVVLDGIELPVGCTDQISYQIEGDWPHTPAVMELEGQYLVPVPLRDTARWFRFGFSVGGGLAVNFLNDDFERSGKANLDLLSPGNGEGRLDLFVETPLDDELPPWAELGLTYALTGMAFYPADVEGPRRNAETVLGNKLGLRLWVLWPLFAGGNALVRAGVGPQAGVFFPLDALNATRVGRLEGYVGLHFPLIVQAAGPLSIQFDPGVRLQRVYLFTGDSFAGPARLVVRWQPVVELSPALRFEW